MIGRYQEALADFDRVIILDDRDDWNWYGRACIYLLASQPDGFRHNLLTALDAARSRLARHGTAEVPLHDRRFYGLRFNIALYLLALIVP